jgi:hypothetical protein
MELKPDRLFTTVSSALTLLLISLLTSATTLADELPQKFEANYTLEMYGITLAKATHKLEHTDKGLSMSVNTRPVGLLAFLYDGHIDIRSEVAKDNGQLLLVNHDYSHKEDNGDSDDSEDSNDDQEPENNTVRYKIDWINNQKKRPAGNVTGIYKGETINIKSDQPVWDPLSIQALIIINADKEAESQKHGLLMKGELKHYILENQGKEEISLNSTTMTALKTFIKEADRDRVIYVWMLPEYHNIPVKYEHWKNGELKTTILLQSVTFEDDGKTDTLTITHSSEEDENEFEDW